MLKMLRAPLHKVRSLLVGFAVFGGTATILLANSGLAGATSPNTKHSTMVGWASYQIVGSNLLVNNFNGAASNNTDETVVVSGWVTGPGYVSKQIYLVLPPCTAQAPWNVPVNRDLNPGAYRIDYYITAPGYQDQHLYWSYNVE